MHSDSISYYYLLRMILEPQDALLTFLADQYGTDSVVGSRISARVPFSIGDLLLYASKSLVALTLVLHSRDCEDAPQEDAMSGSAQRPVGLLTQILWGRVRITQRSPHALGVILQKRGDATGVSRNGNQGMYTHRTCLGRFQAYR